MKLGEERDKKKEGKWSTLPGSVSLFNYRVVQPCFYREQDREGHIFTGGGEGLLGEMGVLGVLEERLGVPGE